MEVADGFLAFGAETWIYDVAEGREDEFRHALVNSEAVLAVEEISDSPSILRGE